MKMTDPIIHICTSTIPNRESSLMRLGGMISTQKTLTGDHFTQFHWHLYRDGPAKTAIHPRLVDAYPILRDKLTFTSVIPPQKQWGHPAKVHFLTTTIPYSEQDVCFFVNDDNQLETTCFAAITDELWFGEARADFVIGKVAMFRDGKQRDLLPHPEHSLHHLCTTISTIDLMNYAVRLTLAKQVGWNHLDYCADFHFIHEYYTKFPRGVILSAKFGSHH